MLLKTETLLKCFRLRHCQGTVIKTHYSNKPQSRRTTGLQQVSKQTSSKCALWPTFSKNCQCFITG